MRRKRCCSIESIGERSEVYVARRIRGERRLQLACAAAVLASAASLVEGLCFAGCGFAIESNGYRRIIRLRVMRRPFRLME